MKEDIAEEEYGKVLTEYVNKFLEIVEGYSV